MFQPELKTYMGFLNHCLECRVIAQPKILAIVTTEGTIVQCGDTVTLVAGYTEKEWLGRCLFDFIHPNERIEVIQKFRSLVENEVPYLLLDTRLAHRSGRWLQIEFASNKIKETGNGRETIVVLIKDIEEKKRKEALSLREQNLEAIGDLAAGVAHEFNNVLTAIMGNISLAKHSLNAGDLAYRRLENAELASEKAAEIARQLLTFSNGGKPIKATTCLERVVRSVVSGHQERHSGITIEISANEGLWPVALDEQQISLVISAFVENACEAIPKDKKVTISMENIEGKNENFANLHHLPYLKMTITDSGHGIEPEIIDRIFDPYFTTRGGKRGMGLTIAYSVIKKHEGLVTVLSAPGNGTTFTVYLPASPK